MVKVGVVGASGYTGLELVKMLVTHSGFQLTYLATTQGDTMIEQLHPSLVRCDKSSCRKSRCRCCG